MTVVEKCVTSIALKLGRAAAETGVLDDLTNVIVAKAPSGLSCCGDLDWGTHFCHLYETPEDLIDTLVPFFVAGITHNEKCIWVTSEPLVSIDAIAALAREMPDLPQLMADGQIHIVDYADWYSHASNTNASSLLQVWLDAESKALADGFSGLRVTGNINFIESREQWNAFEEYERQVSEAFVGHKIIALCSYHLGRTTGTDILDVVQNHNFAVARRRGSWEMIENAATKLVKHELLKTNEKLEQNVRSRTADLQEALASVEEKKHELETALTTRDAGQKQLEAELEDAQLVHSISAELVGEEVMETFYQKLVEAAAIVMRSDFATLQRLDREREALELIAHRGFDDQAQAFWKWVPPQRPTSCGMSLHQTERVIVPNFETWEYSAGADRDAFRAGGVVSAQSTPLLSRSGVLVGMISTHWKVPHVPSERDLRMIDIIARQAADVIERKTAAEALQAQAKSLQEADRRKDEFLAMLAHELRNPLAPIGAAAELLQRVKLDETRVRATSAVIGRQVKHMTGLIDDLLDVSRVTRGLIALDKAALDIQHVVNEAVEQVSPLIRARGHELTIRLAPQTAFVTGDKKRLVQVLANILNNAAKYTAEGGHLALRTSVHDGQVAIDVADDGIGMTPSTAKHAFDLFAQAERSSDRSSGGLGLGLALVKSLVELHGGTVACSSNGLGQGSTFSICLPLLAEERQTASPEAGECMAPATPVALLKILVVDDNVDAAAMLKLLLEALGHEVVVEHGSLRALERARLYKPQVCLVDIGLPEMDGNEVARRLRTQPETAGAMLVAVTGYGQESDRASTLAAGFGHHLVKPVDTATLSSILAAIGRG
jgi:signal transduction histidine kinase